MIGWQPPPTHTKSLIRFTPQFLYELRARLPISEVGDRALSPAVPVRVRRGYAASERFGLKELLGGQGISVEGVVAAGLLIAGDDLPVPWGRFRARVMFPIMDMRGRVIAFGGRALEK